MGINKILVADDEKLIRGFLQTILVKKGFEVTTASNGKEAIYYLETQDFDLVISDMKMPINTGLDVLKHAKKINPKIIVVLMTAFGSIENAVEAMQLGAFNYIIKPFSIESIEAILQKAKEHLSLVEENSYLRAKQTKKTNGIIANSPSMQKILKDINKIAESDASVFISGESGTGKEVFSQLIHNLSNRAQNSYIKVNCAAISSSLLESEFFGHEKGAYTGAENKKLGRFELAHRGTLLLDEITEIPISLQAKLLRAIQEKEFERVGGTRQINVDIRFISTSNRDMLEAINKNIFREDLFFRLNVMPLHLPPLRERKEDIAPLTNYFIKGFCKKYNKKIKTLSHRAKEKLINYPWPGNIRELSNILERIVVLDFGDIVESDHLILNPIESIKQKENNYSSPIELGDNNLTLKQLEKKAILKRLKDLANNQTKTAKALGITSRTLRNKLKEYKNESIIK